MAIDPTLITSVMSNWQTPAPYDALANFAKIQALRNGIVQQQIQQQQLQEGALQLQQQQQAYNDQQALDAAYRGAITTDANGNISYDRAKVLSSVPGHMAPGIQKTLNDMDEAAAKLQKTKADAATAQGDLIGSTLLAIKDANYDPAVFDATLTHAAGIGAIDPRQAAAFRAQLGPNPTPDAIKAAVTPFLATPGVQKLENERATAKAQQERATAATTTATLATEKERLARVDKAKQALGAATNQDQLDQAFKNVIAAGANADDIGDIPRMYSQTAMDAYNNGLMTSEQRATAARDAATQARLAAHEKVMESQGAQRLGIEGARLGLEQQKQAGAMGNLTPDDQAIAQKVASGDISIQQLSRMPNKEAITAAAVDINPNFSANTFATKQAFTDPKQRMSQNLGTIARIVGHIGQFEKNSESIGFAPGYAAGYNLTGDAAALHEDSHAIGAELEKLLAGGVGTQAQVNAWQAALNSSRPGIRQRAVDEISNLIGSQYEGMNQAYKAGLGADLPINQFVSDKGRAWMKAKGIDTGAEPSAAAPAAAAPANWREQALAAPAGARVPIVTKDGKTHQAIKNQNGTFTTLD